MSVRKPPPLVVALLFFSVIGSEPPAPMSLEGHGGASARRRADPEAAHFEADSLGDFPDPFIVRDGESYYAFATGGAGGNIQVATSPDLASWRALPDALPELPIWADRSRSLVWAPSVLRRDGAWVLYYVARDRTSGFQCISRAAATSAGGPYLDRSTEPLVCQISGTSRLCGSIDPSPFVDRDGTPFLLWKSDENSASCRTAPRIWIQRLARDGLSLEGTPTALLAADARWEGRLIEGPSMIEKDGAYYLFYSANAYDTARYAIGYAVCSSATGPCEKKTSAKPLVTTKGNAFGPGGQEFFRDVGGRLFVAYHAWNLPDAARARGSARSLRMDLVRFEGGVPSVPDLGLNQAFTSRAAPRSGG